MPEVPGIAERIAKLCTALRKRGVDLVIAVYDGSGDDRQVEYACCYKSDYESEDRILAHVAQAIAQHFGESYGVRDPDAMTLVKPDAMTIDIPEVSRNNTGEPSMASIVSSIASSIECLVYDSIPGAGWEENSGYFGTFFLNVRTAWVTFKHNTRIESTEYLEVELKGNSEHLL